MNAGSRPRSIAAPLRFVFVLLVLLSTSQLALAAAGVARIHYNRPGADYTGWQLYTWYGALNPSPQWNPAQAPSGSDGFGVYFDVALNTSASGLNFILHDASGNSKNCPNDMYAPFPSNVAAQGMEIWQLQDSCTVYTSQPAVQVGDPSQAKAHFLSHDLIAWPGAAPTHAYRLYYSPTGGITSGPTGISGGQWLNLTVNMAGLPPAVQAGFPWLAGSLALNLGVADQALLPALLRDQLVVAEFNGSTLVNATALQIPGVLDERYPYKGRLGVVGLRDHDGAGERFGFKVWAPTAQSVRVQVFDTETGPVTQTLPMSFDPASGVWSAGGKPEWVNAKYYAYEVTVFVRATGRVETNLVADPYSLAVAAGNARSLIVDLSDPALRPAGWDTPLLGPLHSPADISIYELHVRDFSASDLSVPGADRGKFRAFSYEHSNGMAHLRALADAGLTHVHLLPAFEIASVADSGCITPVIPEAAADSTLQQAAIAPVRDQDCFNWGYDPVLYTVPGGSYASTPTGTARVLEFRQMVQGLHRAGLRVVMDVVFNHTNSSGQSPLSILDKIVPGYYYRLDASGKVLNDSCCQDTATEHAMMGKLLIDSVTTWARQYHVDGFRFDLMSFHPKALMLALKSQLTRIDPGIYLYGEGWNFGAIANDARFVQASQANMAGTGIGTFSDRGRDAVRGGGPFDGGQALLANQGFINGLWYDPNAAAGPATATQRDLLNRDADWIRLALTGTLKDYVFVDRNGNTKTGAQIDYNGQAAGYTLGPADVVNYISAHDNTTLFDNDQYKLPSSTSMADRVRVNSLGVAIVALSQGVPFFHAGDELLRSKSFDSNSFNSGDWFNKLDFSMQSNNWGVGLPPAFSGNDGNWSVMQPLLANPALKPAYADIAQADAVFKDWLRIRRSLPLLRLPSDAEIRRRVHFYNQGPGQVPGLIVMGIDGGDSPAVDADLRGILVVINATASPVNPVVPGYQGRHLMLHPIQARGADVVARSASFSTASGAFSVPPRTAAVFVEPR